MLRVEPGEGHVLDIHGPHLEVEKVPALPRITQAHQSRETHLGWQLGKAYEWSTCQPWGLQRSGCGFQAHCVLADQANCSILSSKGGDDTCPIGFL